jgi:hypothetical protein
MTIGIFVSILNVVLKCYLITESLLLVIYSAIRNMPLKPRKYALDDYYACHLELKELILGLIEDFLNKHTPTNSKGEV